MKKLRSLLLLLLLLSVFTVGASAASYDGNGFGSDGSYQPAKWNNGYYEISNAGQLYWFAQKVNGGSTAINGRLTADITITRCRNEGAIESTKATCAQSGLTDGEKCLICGEMAVEQEEIPTLDHSCAVTEWVWAEDLSEASAVLTCEACSHTETVAAQVTAEQTTAPTLAAEGVCTHTAVVMVNDVRCTDTRQSAIPATGPSLIEDVVFSVDPDTGAVTAKNLPEGVVVILAAYDGGRMDWCRILTGGTLVPVPETGALRAFFLTEDRVPVAAPREITF